VPFAKEGAEPAHLGLGRLINAYRDRFLFGTDNLAPRERETHLAIYRSDEPLWKRLTPATRKKALRGNYERIFDEARAKVRAWEPVHGDRE
jgi:hypothetical protein